MRIDATRLWEQVRLGEDSDLELKEARFRGLRVSAPRRDDLADEFAAFANSSGGRLVLGVSDDRQSQSLAPEQLDALAGFVSEICSDSIEPSLDFSIYRVPVPPPAEGGALLVEIPASVVVHRTRRGYFRRRGDSRRQMQPARSGGCCSLGGNPTPQPPIHRSSLVPVSIACAQSCGGNTPVHAPASHPRSPCRS